MTLAQQELCPWLPGLQKMAERCALEVTPTKWQNKSDFCAGWGCTNGRRKPGCEGKSFHVFPADEERCRLWVCHARRKDLMSLTAADIRRKKCKLCSDHFEASQWTNSDQKRLNWNAVPTVFRVSNPPPHTDIKRLNVKDERARNVAVKATAKLAKKRFKAFWTAGNAGHRLICPENAEATLKIKVEIDYAEDPALHWMSTQPVAEVLPHTDIKPLVIKTEPKDIDSEPSQVSTVPFSMRPEPLDIKTEPKNINCEPLHGGIVPSSMRAEHLNIKTEPEDIGHGPQHVSSSLGPELLDIKPEPNDIDCEPLQVTSVPFSTRTEHLDIKTEPNNIDCEPLQVTSVPFSLRSEHLDIKTEPRDIDCESQQVSSMPFSMRPEHLAIKTELVYFEDQWAG